MSCLSLKLATATPWDTRTSEDTKGEEDTSAAREKNPRERSARRAKRAQLYSACREGLGSDSAAFYYSPSSLLAFRTTYWAKSSAVSARAKLTKHLMTDRTLALRNVTRRNYYCIFQRWIIIERDLKLGGNHLRYPCWKLQWRCTPTVQVTTG